MNDFNSYRPSSFKLLPDVIKNLLILNGLFYLATIVLWNKFQYDLTDVLGLHFMGAEKFRPWQFVSYMFLHDPSNFSHIFFNMFALWMFGGAIENYWGPKRFLTYYFITGFGAALLQYTVFYFEMKPTLDAIDSAIANPTFATMHDFLISPHLSINTQELQEVYIRFLDSYQLNIGNPNNAQAIATQFLYDYKANFLNQPNIIGASGAVFGLLLAFGMMFPNSIIYVYFAIPMKAKYFVMLYGALELFMGVSGSQSNVAHFAHLGGMLFGFLLIMYWRKKR